MTEVPAPTARATRPAAVTAAAAMSVVGAVVTLVGIFSVISQLRTSRVRAQVSDLLDQPRFSAAGLDIDTVMTGVRIGLMVCAAACVAAVVLAVFVLRRHRPARVTLTVLGAVAAVVALFAGTTGVLVGAYVVLACALLWTRSARQWFVVGSGGQAEPTARPGESAMSSTGPGQGQGGREGETSPGGGDQGPVYPGGPPGYGQAQPPSYGQGQPPGYGQGQPPGYGQGPPPYQPYPQGGSDPGYPGFLGGPSPYPSRRPRTITAASVITWVASGIMVILLAIAIAATHSTGFEAEIQRQLRTNSQLRDANVTVDTIRNFVVGAATIGIVLALIAIALAWFVFRRRNWARILLVILSALTALGGLLSFRSGYGLLLALAGIAVIVLLFTGNAGAWFKGRTAEAGPPGYPPYQQSPWQR